MALRAAANDKANPVILEPIMKVEVVIPEDYLGDVMGHVTSRRGRLKEWKLALAANKLSVQWFHYAEMFGYATTLRSTTQGRGTFTNDIGSLRRSTKINCKKKSLRKTAEKLNHFLKPDSIAKRLSKETIFLI